MENILEKLAGTMPGEKIIQLLDVYKSLGEHQKRFQEKFGVSCISGCGNCCEHYVPYLTESEALVAAYVALRDDRVEEIMARLNNFSEKDTVCPLYNKEGEYHCSLYEGRSMVCRLFGLSVSQDKGGKMVWRPCHWKDGKGEVLDGSVLEANSGDVPVMSHYGEKLEECGGTEGELIDSAVSKAIWKIKMILEMTESFPA
ncbi:MAG: YkgJ family cysteine cluster protein [Candidatus Ornithospirochaeta sp.]